MARLVVDTALPAAECFRRIADRTDPWHLGPVSNPTDTLVARLDPPRFKLTTQSSIWYRGTKVIFYGRMKEVAGRTRIYGRLGLSVSSLLLFSLAIAIPAALQTYTLEWMPGPDRFELRAPLYWAVVLLFFRAVGAWDSGGPADRYSLFLTTALRGPDPPGAVSLQPRD